MFYGTLTAYQAYKKEKLSFLIYVPSSLARVLLLLNSARVLSLRISAVQWKWGPPLWTQWLEWTAVMQVHGPKIGYMIRTWFYTAVGGPRDHLYVWVAWDMQMHMHMHIYTQVIGPFVSSTLLLWLKSHGSESNGGNHCIKSITLSFI